MPRHNVNRLPFDLLATRHPRLSIEAEVLAVNPNWPVLPEEIGNVTNDGSLRPTARFPSCYEARIGPSRPQDFVRNVQRTFKILEGWSINIAANYSCGLHVHMDMSRIRAEERGRVVSRWLMYEPLFFACIPAARIRNRYCAPLNGHFTGVAYPFGASNDWITVNSEYVHGLEHGFEGRYLALNPSAMSRHGTYEVRIGAGTANPNRAIEWAYVVCRSLYQFGAMAVSDREKNVAAAFKDRNAPVDIGILWNTFNNVVMDADVKRIMSQMSYRNRRTQKLMPYIKRRADGLYTRGMVEMRRGEYLRNV